MTKYNFSSTAGGLDSESDFNGITFKVFSFFNCSLNINRKYTCFETAPQNRQAKVIMWSG